MADQAPLPQETGSPVGRGVIAAAAALARWQADQQRKDIDASRQTPEERRMSRGADEKGLSAFGQATATTPDTVSWHPLSRTSAMLSEFDQSWPEIQRAGAKLTGLPTGPLPPPAQPLGQAYLRGKKAAEKSREEQMADMPWMPSASDTLFALAGFPIRRKGAPVSKMLASGARNVAVDLGSVVSAIPGLVAHTILPRMKLPGETDEQAAARAIEEGRQLGRGVKQGLLGGTADILEHPLESALTKPFTTAVTMGGPMRAAANLGKAGLMKAGVSPESFAPPLVAESPILNRAIEHLRDGLVEHGGKPGKLAGGLIDQYLAKFADGFHSGDPRVTVMAEKFARDKEMAMASAKAAIGRMAGGAAREMERVPVPPDQLPGLPGQAPSPIAPGAPPAPDMTMPPKPTGTPTGTAGEMPSAAPQLTTSAPVEPGALGPQAPLLDRATHVLRESLKGMPEADEFIAEFTRNFNEGHPRAAVMADALVNDPALAQSVIGKFKTIKNFAESIYKSMSERDGAGAPPSGPTVPPVPGVPDGESLRPVKEQVAKQRLYGAQDLPSEIPVEVPRDVAAGERVSKFGPGVTRHVPEVVDEFMRSNMLPDEARPAVTQDVMLALEDAMGGAGKTANWRGQMRGNPERFAKEYLAAAEAKVGSPLTDKVKAQLLDTIDKRDKEGLELISIQRHPEGGFEVVRTTRVPHTPSRGGEVFELHPEELVGPRRLDAPEVRNAVQSQLEETMRRNMGATDVGHHARLESERAVSTARHGAAPVDVLDVAHRLYADAVVDDLVQGVSSRSEAIRQVAQAAYNIIEARRKGDVIPQVLPVGMRPAAVGEVIREVGKVVEEPVKNVPLRNPFAKAPKTEGVLGAPESAALEGAGQPMLEGDPVTPPAMPTKGALARPMESSEPAVVDTTAERAPPRKLTSAESKQLHDLAWEVQGYRPLHEGVGFGTKSEPAYGNVLLGDALKWHALSEKALKEDGAIGLLNKWLKSNVTNKSISSGVNNIIPNISHFAINHGVDPITMLANGAEMLQELADWHGKDAAHVSADNAKAFKNLDRAGLGMDFVQHELGDKAMSPSQVLRLDPFTAWMRNPATDLPHTRAAKWFYRFGDQVIRVQEGVMQFKNALRDIEGLKNGEFYDLSPTKRQQVRVTKQGDKFFIEDPYALEADARKPTEVTEDQLERMVGKHAAHRATRIVQDYPDMPQAPKILSTSKLDVLAAPFKSWQAGAADLPGKAGIVTNTMFRSPYAVSTNSASALGRAGARELRATLAKSTIVNGLRAELLKQGANGPLADNFRSRPDDDQHIIIGNLMDPRMIEGLKLAQWANIGPTADYISAAQALFTQPEVERQHKMAEAGKSSGFTTFAEAVMDADSGRGFTAARAIRMAMLSGGPIANLWAAYEKDATDGRPLNLEKLTTGLANSLVGGTNAAIARSAAGYLADTGPEAHPRLPVGPVREALADLSGRAETTESHTGSAKTPAYAQPLLSYILQQVIGKAWQASDVQSMNPHQAKSFLHKMGLAMKAGAGIVSEEHAKAQAKSDVAHAQPAERADQMALERQETAAQKNMRKAIDRTVKSEWLKFRQLYRTLNGIKDPNGSE